MFKFIICYFLVQHFVSINCKQINSKFPPQNCYKFNDRGEAFQLVWSDNFDSSNVNVDNWLVENETGECKGDISCDRPENVQIINNYLVLMTRREAYHEYDFTGARITTQQQLRHGRVELRLAQPTGRIIQPCIYTVNPSESYWHESGQIVLSCFTSKRSYYRNVYFAGSEQENDFVAQFPRYPKNPNQFHVYGFEWDHNGVRFFIDDQYGDLIKFNGTKTVHPYQNLRIWIKVGHNEYHPSLYYPANFRWSCPALVIDHVKVYRKDVRMSRQKVRKEAMICSDVASMRSPEEEAVILDSICSHAKGQATKRKKIGMLMQNDQQQANVCFKRVPCGDEE